jgi:hypothetical protein
VVRRSGSQKWCDLDTARCSQKLTGDVLRMTPLKNQDIDALSTIARSIFHDNANKFFEL